MVAAEEVIRERMKDPNLIVDVESARKELLETKEEWDRIEGT